MFDELLAVDQLETDGKAIEIKPTSNEEDLVEPDTLVAKPLLIHAMERMTLPRYDKVYSLVSGTHKNLLYPLLRPQLFLGALLNIETTRGGEIHFEEFAKFVLRMKREYSDRRLLWLVFEELLPPTMGTESKSLRKGQAHGAAAPTLGHEVAQLFRLIDTNSDGSLSKTELLSAVTRRRKREVSFELMLFRSFFLDSP